MKVRRRCALLFSMFLFTGNLRAAAQTPAPSSSSIVHELPEPHVDYEKYILPNGLQVILVPNSRVPKVHVNLLYHVGSKNEPQDRTGFAHLFEHMMLEGSKNAAVRYATLIEAAGGITNAYTTQDQTDFFAIVGDFDASVTKKWIEKYFGPIPPAPSIARPARWIPRLDSEKVIDVQDHVAEERSYLAWITPIVRSTENVRVELAARLLGRRLNADLVYSDKPLCSEVSTEVTPQEDASVFTVVVSARPGASLAHIEQKVDAQIALRAEDGPSPDELQQTKRRVEYAELSQFDTLQSTAETLNRGNAFAADPAYYAVSWRRMETATPEEISSAVRQYLDTKQRVLLRFHPDLAQAQKTAALHRSVAPALVFGPSHPYARPVALLSGLQNAQRDVLRTFYDSYWKPHDAALIFATALQGGSEGVQQTGLVAVRAAVARYADPKKASLLVVGDRRRIESGLRELHLGPVVVLDLDGKPLEEVMH